LFCFFGNNISDVVSVEEKLIRLQENQLVLKERHDIQHKNETRYSALWHSIQSVVMLSVVYVLIVANKSIMLSVVAPLKVIS
jgi:hypothetical protein